MTLFTVLALWAGAALFTLVCYWRRDLPGSGLLLAYLMSFAQLHWLASALYLNPAYSFYNYAVVRAGLEQSLYAMAAFMLGSVLIAPAVLQYVVSREQRRGSPGPDPLLPKLYLGIGAACFLMLWLTGLGSVPSITSLIASGEQFAVVGLCLICWTAVLKQNYLVLAAALGASLVLPYVTLMAQGFMSFGAAAATVVFAFIGNLIRPRWLVIMGGILLGYVGLSVYVGYMRDRSEIRATVWGRRSMEDRLDTIRQSISRFEWFDPRDRVHCERVDIRLNQNMLVGTAAMRMDPNDYTHGETIRDGVLALVPRAVWPDKPMTAGSGNLVSDFTGIRFAEGTSIGVGHVLELFINFGTWGVAGGFLILGTLVTLFDWLAGRALSQGDWPGFAFRLLVGLCLLNVIGSFVETFSSAAASVIVATLVNRAVVPAFRELIP